MRRMKTYTKSEKKVFDALQNKPCATAEELYSEINARGKEKEIGLTSVYRALKQLEKNYEIKPISFNDGKARYDLNTNEKHHHYFVCTECGKVEKIDFCPFEALKIKFKKDYIIQYHNFKLFGICSECKTKNAGTSAPA